MIPSKLLIANRGEIAIRVARAAADLGIRTAAVFSEDDEYSLHRQMADEAYALDGFGVKSYLDIEKIIDTARQAGCDAIHPGYGFLSEKEAFAKRCKDENITFVGPRTEILELFGDKVRARELAESNGVPILRGTRGPTSLEQARNFFEALPEKSAMIIKAIEGGGGRGMRVVSSIDEFENAFKRCRSEALAALGNGDVYVEQLMPRARHIEVQIAGDGSGAVIHLGERDCSIQRRHQKLIEIAPSPGLPDGLRARITNAAISLAAAVRYDNIGTFEFLVDSTDLTDESMFAFLETNPRLQVEHTVTEEVFGVDLVAIQLSLAGGQSLEKLGLTQKDMPNPRGFSIQVRVNLETMNAQGSVLPSSGTLEAFDPPTGPGVRVDSYGYAGYTTNPRFDSLLAKLIVHRSSGGFTDTVNKTHRALTEFRIAGAPSNIPFLQSVLKLAAFQNGDLYTRFIDDHIDELLVESDSRRRFFQPNSEPAHLSGHAGVRVDPNDPLAVLTYGQAENSGPFKRMEEKISKAPVNRIVGPGGTVPIEAPLQGTVVSIDIREGDTVIVGQCLLIMESMKMEHEIRADKNGIVQRIAVAVGDTIYQGHPLMFIRESEAEGFDITSAEAIDLDEIRPDLKEVLDRHAITLDEKRPGAVARRRAKQQRTARENIEDLCDPGTFLEYSPLVLAAQRQRRSVQELIEISPADGLVAGIGAVNGDLFGDPASRCVIMSYDYTVFAGTQGRQNHRKKDRMIDIAKKGRMPMMLFAEGGGGRPGDTDGIDGGTSTFANFATLSGLVPMVGITSGRCFAGNASLLGCCDVIIATADSNIGMGGPAMIEGGGLGVFKPEEIGTMDIQVANGVVDIAVKDEAEAVAVAKKYLAYFQGALSGWDAPDQRVMRHIVPENRLRVYKIHEVIDTLADIGSVLELRKNFGIGMVTSLIRIEGRPLGVIANNPMHLGGAIDSDGSDKAARFMQLCDAFDLPILFLCDTPGIMVGPEIEKTALVRHSSRMFLTGANLSVPFFTIILRKAYGLGAIAMGGGSFKTPYFSVAWPTGEFGGMGIEGRVKLGYRKELAKIENSEERTRVYSKMVADEYEHGKSLNAASYFRIDDTIDPADSRRWVAGLLRSIRMPPRERGKKRPLIDAW
ncbi:carboxyl transferase domain-containing protein [Thermodesulfobacteriota bacterium]